MNNKNHKWNKAIEVIIKIVKNQDFKILLIFIIIE